MQEMLKEYHAVITEAWKYLKYLTEKYDRVGVDKIDWSEVIDKGCEISKRYGESKFVVTIVLGCMEEFERMKNAEEKGSDKPQGVVEGA